MADVTASGSGGAGLGTLATRWALGGVWALGVIRSVIQSGWMPTSPLRVAAFGIALIGAIALTTPGDRILDPVEAVLVGCCALGTASLLLASQPAVGRIWLFDFSSYLVALLLARGNSVIGATGCALVVSLGVTWAVLVGGSATATVDLVAVSIMASIVGVTWRLVLRRIVALERFHRTAEARAALDAELAEESALADRRELAEVWRAAGPLLGMVAEGRTLDGALIRELAVAEASIRDRIRSPWVVSPELARVISDRRRQGVDVLVLGEASGPRTTIPPELAGALVSLVARQHAGRIVIRAVPPGREDAVSVLLAGDGSISRILLADDGTVISRN